MSLLNCCIVRKLYTETNKSILSERGSEIRQFIARPFDSNILKMPIKGEVVAIINFISSDSTTNLNRKISYYMTNINLWNSSHHNALPNISALDELQKTTSENVKKPEDGNPFLEGGELPDLGEFFTEMKRKYPCMFICLSQLNRNIDNPDRAVNGKYGNYVLESDIFGSDAMLQHADTLIGLNRPAKQKIRNYGPDRYIIENDRTLVLHFLKARNGDTRMSFFKAEFERMQISEMDTQPQEQRR